MITSVVSAKTHMIGINEIVWDCDIEAAVLSLTRATILDTDYWLQTVSRVEDGLHPTAANQPLTMNALSEWLKRCVTAPPTSEELTSHEGQPRIITPANRTVRHETP